MVSSSRDHDPSPVIGAGSAPNMEACRAELTALAQMHFDASNQPKRPQWFRKSQAHAFAGVFEAIHVFNKHFPPSVGDGATTTRPPQVERDSSRDKLLTGTHRLPD